MTNGTSTASSTSTSTSPTSTSNSTSTSSTPSTSPTTSAPAPATQPKQGLSGSQIGGIVGGVVGAVFLLGVIALFLFFRRRKGQGDLPQEGPDVQGPVSGADKPVVVEEGVGKDVPMLEGSMRQEMDAQGAAALHEMEGASGRGMVGVGGEKGAGVSELEGQRTVVAELDGASVVRGSGG
ncbi:hypothetical protein BDV36DRAFT_298693 [Aspergillus pseudocaelatus]|uniref:Uncharacterized protein n=1 Tax=Aspergillus pseudocaelatus TaxID=1825620 RepID=A0ABQ6WDT6_9EURO|nr:hypothetical protein BDV36DRAFT_298693 [Aspergillus pseudocaelatus]